MKKYLTLQYVYFEEITRIENYFVEKKNKKVEKKLKKTLDGPPKK